MLCERTGSTSHSIDLTQESVQRTASASSRSGQRGTLSDDSTLHWKLCGSDGAWKIWNVTMRSMC